MSYTELPSTWEEIMRVVDDVLDRRTVSYVESALLFARWLKFKAEPERRELLARLEAKETP